VLRSWELSSNKSRQEEALQEEAFWNFFPVFVVIMAFSNMGVKRRTAVVATAAAVMLITATMGVTMTQAAAPGPGSNSNDTNQSALPSLVTSILLSLITFVAAAGFVKIWDAAGGATAWSAQTHLRIIL
jgi:hypothetical protein